MENGEAASWLDGRQAGRVLGLSADGVRKRAIRGLIQHRKGNDGRLRYLIPTDAVENVSEDIPQTLSETSFRHSADTSLLVENAKLTERLAAEERRSSELQVRVDRLEAALALARKGWLERLIEAMRRK